MTTFEGPPIRSADALPHPRDYPAFHPFLKGVFSQWHATPFVLEGLPFVTAEQWMMFAKARLFGDTERGEAILATPDPAKQKRHGQAVRGFEPELWDRWKVDIVYRGNLAKFRQNAGAARQLAATRPAMLVEANPRDWIWGVGLAAEDPAIMSPSEWRGENLLGRVLTAIREDIGAS